MTTNLHIYYDVHSLNSRPLISRYFWFFIDCRHQHVRRGTTFFNWKKENINTHLRSESDPYELYKPSKCVWVSSRHIITSVWIYRFHVVEPLTHAFQSTISAMVKTTVPEVRTRGGVVLGIYVLQTVLVAHLSAIWAQMDRYVHILSVNR